MSAPYDRVYFPLSGITTHLYSCTDHSTESVNTHIPSTSQLRVVETIRKNQQIIGFWMKVTVGQAAGKFIYIHANRLDELFC